MDLLVTPLMNMMEKKLDVSALRQKVIANNVANVDTPGFKASHVEFEDILQQAMNKDNLSLHKTDPRHIDPSLNLQSAQARVVIDNTTTLRNDGNNVDIDKEMSDLAKNGIDYQAISQILGQKYSGKIKLITDLGKA
ncbi:flagellar basal body rod protein FlgB [Desulfosporosinus sp. FKA]|uniref:flagellar basal body rod protein FlgB n=1 Tax=Desulfosporosinus sp. FKA TaxID=1969834 RepID=UPI000B4A519F|nr:flagellar basal body rod protein FlgB [Desulfosporosinus sp. FKA]